MWSPKTTWEVGPVRLPSLQLFIQCVGHPLSPPPLHWQLVMSGRAGTDRVVTRKEPVRGDPCPAPSPPATAVTLGAPSSLVCLGRVRGWGQGQQARGTASSRATSGTNKTVWLCTEPCCPSQWAPCPQPETLSRPPCWLRELGEGGACLAPSPGWPLSGQPSFCISYSVSSGLVALRRASQVTFPSFITSPLYGVCCPRPPGLLHHLPLPGGPLPHPPPSPAASSFHQEISIRRFPSRCSHHLPTPSLWTLERLECDQCWQLRGLTW